MKWKFFSCIIFLVGLGSCFSSDPPIHHVKDLDENMIDLRAYHENLGAYLTENNKEYAAWLSHEMDSILQLMADRFPEHRKLTESFNTAYKKRMKPYMKELIKAVDEENWPAAIKAYKTLTRKCNGCHIDHDIDKQVLDWSE